MKKAALFHGTNGTPHDHWFPWLSAELKQYGYQVFAPELPENHTPNRDIYEAFLKKSGWDFADNVLFGHSSGTTTILNLLMANWFPNIKAAVLVGTFLNEKLTVAADWYEPGQFDGLFVQEFDAEKIKRKCPEFIFLHGDDDYACDYDDAEDFCSQLGGSFITIQNGGHLSNSSGITKLPQIINEMKKLEIL